jgi:predicted Zn-dependent protease
VYDDVVNAFALPGGFIYVTRGILSNLNNEAHLAGVLGHEISHVTAMHSVIRICETQLAHLGLGVAGAVAPGLQNYLGLAGAGLQLMFLKFSRKNELQADELGVRYVAGVRENPQELISVMQTLEQVSRLSGGEAIPEWSSAHPTPANREQRLAEQIQTLVQLRRAHRPAGPPRAAHAAAHRAGRAAQPVLRPAGGARPDQLGRARRRSAAGPPGQARHRRAGPGVAAGEKK